MRHMFLCSCALLFVLTASAQNFGGQWKGSFTAFGSAEQDEYVLELQITNKTQVSGYSYTYFYQGNTRYFTICRITGTLNRSTRTVTVTEIEKIKGDVPPGDVDCLQVHTLTYFKGEEGEVLEGKWKPAPGFDKGCGFGTTSLSRTSLASVTAHPKPPADPPDSTIATTVPNVPSAPNKNSAPAKSGAPTASGAAAGSAAAKSGTTKKSGTTAKGGTTSKSTSATAKSGTTKPKTSATKPPTTGAVAKTAVPAAGAATMKSGATAKGSAPVKGTTPKDTTQLKMQGSETQVSAAPPPTSAPIKTPPPPEVRARSENLIQTVILTSPEIRIELYDDGVIDHDTVTVYFNGKAVIEKNMLTHSPIKVTLQALPGADNELILFADNLGDIPPNTALMVVYAGEEKYDIRVTSDLKTNGAVRFVLKDSK